MDEFTKQAKENYDNLEKREKELKRELSEIKTEKQALKVFLQAKGVISKQPRKKQPPSSQ